jgi:DNA repair protein RadD
VDLRLYQQLAVESGLRSLQGGTTGGGLIVLPVGSGKSHVLAQIAQQLDAPSLIFQPSREILEQNASKLLAYGYEPAVYSASMGMKDVGKITLATIGSVKSRPDLFQDVRHVIIDEADLVNAKAGMYRDFLSSLRPDTRVLGLTATPFRLSSSMDGSIMKFLTRTRPRVFSDVVHVSQISDLMKQGYLCPLVYQEVRGFDRMAVTANSTGGDYEDRSLQKHLGKIQFRSLTRRTVKRLLEIGRRRILVFSRFLEDAEDLAASVPGTYMVTGETPSEHRRDLLAAFKAGEVPVVVNVGVLVAGFDYPALDTVVLARPTLSLRLYMQMVGRVVRQAPGKTDAWVVDMVGLKRQFGAVEDLHIGHEPGHRVPLWEVSTHGRALTNVLMRRG